MTTVTVKLPGKLNVRLAAEAGRKHMTKSAVIRQLLENALRSPTAGSEASCYELTKDLCGSIHGAPRDLSSNKKHLEGYGC
jgi:hypothetical protein